MFIPKYLFPVAGNVSLAYTEGLRPKPIVVRPTRRRIVDCSRNGIVLIFTQPGKELPNPSFPECHTQTSHSKAPPSGSAACPPSQPQEQAHGIPLSRLWAKNCRLAKGARMGGTLAASPAGGGLCLDPMRCARGRACLL
jgi:hypothetical protein